MVDIIPSITTFPLSCFIGIFVLIFFFTFLLSFNDIRERYLQWRDDRNRLPIFHYTLVFFDHITGLITLIGVIVAVISLPAVFIPPFFGESWYEFLIATPLGAQLIDSITFATIFSVFFVYTLASLIFVIWLNDIFLNRNVTWGEAFFSLLILLIGAVAAFCINYFVLIVYCSKSEIVISLIELNALLFIVGIALILMISGLFQIGEDFPHRWIQFIFYLLAGILFIIVIMLTMIPAYNINLEILNITHNYSVLDNASFSFETIPIPHNNTPMVLLIRPNYSQYSCSNINTEYAQCHWSTNYGHFFTVNSNDSFTSARTNDFIIPSCILASCNQKPEDAVYWTYDLSDFGKNKSPVIISLRVENPNKKLLNGKWKNTVDYIIGSAHQNFTWIDFDTPSNVSINHIF
jgi:hypothetical protein